jgi:plasmid stabilization system protein ParE
MRFEFHPEALDEYEDAARYYAHCQEGLEVRFIDCVESTLQRICEAPERSRRFEKDVRRCLVHIFPYAVLYSVEADYVLIIAVMHCSRKPGYWRNRVKNDN